MQRELRLQLVDGQAMAPELRERVYALCDRAYEMDLRPLFAVYTGATHVLGFLGDTLASHAMWVTRELQLLQPLLPPAAPALRTAYVEMVATEPGLQGRGLATAIMRRLAQAITDYDLAALSPAEGGLYTRLGWQYWRGPLFIRTAIGLLPTPEDRVMILRLPRTPALDLDQPLSAGWREGELW